MREMTNNELMKFGMAVINTWVIRLYNKGYAPEIISDITDVNLSRVIKIIKVEEQREQYKKEKEGAI